MWYELATNFCIINSKRQVEGELRHVVQIDVAVFRKGESKTLQWTFALICYTSLRKQCVRHLETAKPREI